ncbi:MAG: ATPase domain-containing protein [Thermoplasmata archaeon]
MSPPAKKKMVTCKECGKKYSSEEEECPHCAREKAEAGQPMDADEKAETIAQELLGEKAKYDDQEDIAKWLMGESKDFTWSRESTAGAEVSSEAQDETDDSSRVIEDWLKGKVVDIASWLTAEPGAEAIPGEEVLIPSEIEREELEKAKENLRALVDDFKAGKLPIDIVANRMNEILSTVEMLKSENSRLKEELESVRKSSTAIAKYFKSVYGSENIEAGEIADRLSKEMAAREQLEIENLQLKSSLEIYKDKVEKGLLTLPADEQELKRMQVELEEKELALEEMKKFLEKKEKELACEETDTRTEMRERFTAELQDRISEFEKREASLKSDVERLTLRNKELELSLKQKNDELQLLMQKSGGAGLTEALKQRLADMQRLERELALRNEEVIMLRDKLQAKEDEMNALKEPMRYKEDELLRREEDLLHREKLLEEEIKRLQQQKAEMGSQTEIELKKRLEQLQAEITRKEEEIKAKEKFIRAKEEELKLREQGVIGKEIEKREEERALEFKIEKVKTGTARLDDLLMGGLPFGSNVLIYGPPFMGKEVLVDCFVAEGLSKGVPVIWVTTEKTPSEIREEMNFVISGFEEYEKLGLVRFIDSYSRSMGDQANDPNVTYIESPTDFQGIQNAIEAVAKELMKKHKYYRFVFRSVSTMIAYLDPATAFRFLNPIAGRRKRDKAVSMYLIEKGMHGEQEIQMVGSLMDGMIEFKVENLNTFLSVKGIGDVQSRAWIRYTSSKSGVNIGSFALDHIR